MQRLQFRLYIGARAHPGGGADQDAYRAPAHFGKQFIFLYLRFCIVDKGDFRSGDTAADELAPQVMVHIVESAVRAFGARCGQIAEDHLRQAFRLPFFIDAQRFPHTGIDLAVRVVRQRGVDQPRVQRQQPPVVGNAQHIVLMGVYAAPAHHVRAPAQFGNHFLLGFAGLRADIPHLAALERRDWQIEHVGRLDVRDLAEHAHQLRQVIKLAEPGFQAIACALRGQFDGRLCLPENCCPGIEV